MRQPTTVLSLTLVLAIAALRPAGAIVIRHDRDDAEYRALGERYPAVCRVMPDGTGTLVAPLWVVTAAHVAQGVERRGGAVRFGDDEYAVRKVFLHPDWQGREHDVALLQLDRPVVGAEPVGLWEGKDEAGLIVTFIGSGDFGTGLTGPQRMDGVRRGATNRVDAVDDAWIKFRFDDPDQATPLEGISGPGDSGGPALVERDGRVWILGVSSAGTNEKGQKPGTYGTGELYTRVSTHLEWLRGILQGGGKGVEVTRRAPGGAVPREVARARALAFLEAYNSDDEAKLTAFFRDNMVQDETRPPTERRVANLRKLYREHGALRIVQTIVDGPSVRMTCEGAGGRLTLGFEIAGQPPHLIDQVGIEAGPGVPPAS